MKTLHSLDIGTRFLDTKMNTPMWLRQAGMNDEQAQYFMIKYVNKLAELFLLTVEVLNAIDSDDNLSTQGKESKKQAAMDSLRKKIEKMGDDESYSARIKHLEGKMQMKPLKLTGNQVNDFMLQVEARKMLGEMAESQVIEVYLAACRTGDKDFIVSAIEDSPLNSIQTLLDQSVIEQGRAVRLQRQYPDEHAELQLMRGAQEVFVKVMQKAFQIAGVDQ